MPQRKDTARRQAIVEAVGSIAPLTPAALEALVDCHADFVRVLGQELVQTMAVDERRVEPSHIQAALEKLGYENLWNEAVEMVDQVAPPKKKAPKSKRKRAAFTEEEMAEQERLLSQSKERLLSKGKG